MRERANSVLEISVFPTEIPVNGLESLPYEHFSTVTGMKAGKREIVVHSNKLQ